MRCSNCSAKVRPIVAVDIDGTLGDYHGHFLKFAGEYLGPDYWAPEVDYVYDGSRRFRDWFCEVFEVELRTFRDIKLAYRQGAQKRMMPAYPNATVFMRSLRQRCELWVTTTRPFMRHDSIDPDTREWLRRNEMPYAHMLYDDDKYGRLAELVDPERVVAVLEDEPEQYDRAEELGMLPILRKQKYNRGVRRTIMADLEAAHLMILEHLNIWEKRYEHHR